jgi:hypothetical protein
MEGAHRDFVDLVQTWNNGTVRQRQEMTFSLYPEGWWYRPKARYFEPHNVPLINRLQETIGVLMAGKNIGAGDGI